jgi:hypothetical protein
MLNLSLHRGSLSKNAEGGQAQFSSKKSVKNYMSGKAEHCVYQYQSGGGNCLSKKL